MLFVVISTGGFARFYGYERACRRIKAEPMTGNPPLVIGSASMRLALNIIQFWKCPLTVA